MPTEPVFLRWEHTTPPHCKFYEVEVELSLFFPKRLVRRWGRIGGKRPRSIRMLVADGEELQRPAASGARLPAGAGAAGGGDGGGSGVRVGCYSAFEIGPHRRFYGIVFR